jgi:hypothetical protein
VERFNDNVPNAKAGHGLRTDQDANSSYQDDLFNAATTWAPFASQIDWEVACWCKLRGPSSTAFSDLLKINGVRLVFWHLAFSHPIPAMGALRIVVWLYGRTQQDYRQSPPFTPKICTEGAHRWGTSF